MSEKHLDAVESAPHFIGNDVRSHPRRSSIHPPSLSDFSEFNGQTNHFVPIGVDGTAVLQLRDVDRAKADAQRGSGISLTNEDVYLLLQQDRAEQNLKVSLEEGLELIKNRPDSEEPTASVERSSRPEDGRKLTDRDSASNSSTGKSSNSARYSPLLDNLRLMQMLSGKEQHEITRKPRTSIDSRRSSGTNDAPQSRRGSLLPADGSSSVSSSRRGSLQNQHMDHKQYQMFQVQRLKYWEQRQRIQQQRKEIELMRKASQQQQIIQIYQQQQQQQYINQWQQQQQRISRQRQQVQQVLHNQQEILKTHVQNKARRSSAPTLRTQRPMTLNHSGHMANDFAAKMSLQAAAAAAAASPVAAVGKTSTHTNAPLMQQPQQQAVAGRSRGVWPWAAAPLGAPSPVPRSANPAAAGLISAADLAHQQAAVASSGCRPAGAHPLLGSNSATLSACTPITSPAAAATSSSLMTNEEKEWIRQLHLQSIPSGRTLEHFNSDYYCIKLTERRARRDGKPVEPFTLLTQTERVTQTGGNNGGGTESAAGDTWQQGHRAPPAALVPGALGGRISTSSVHRERELVDLESESANRTPHATESFNITYKPLLAIEQAFDQLLALEEYERKTAIPRGDVLLISQPERRDQTLRSIMSLLGFGPEINVPLVNEVLCTSKGVSLIARVLPAIPQETAQQVAMMAFKHLSFVGSSQDCDIYGIRNVLPALARSLAVVIKQCELPLLLKLLEHLLRLPEASDGSPGAVAVLCYGNEAVASLLTALVTGGFDQCLLLESVDGTLSRDIIYWRHLTMKLYYLLEAHSSLIYEDESAKLFFSQLILHVGSSFTDMFMKLEEDVPTVPSASRHQKVLRAASIGTPSMSGTNSSSSSMTNQFKQVLMAHEQYQQQSEPLPESPRCQESRISVGSRAPAEQHSQKPLQISQSPSKESAAPSQASANLSKQRHQRRRGSRHGDHPHRDDRKQKSVTIVRLDCRQ
eukprot:scpid36982/ scgid24631/ 